MGSLLVFEPGAAVSRVIAREPLGAWALTPLDRLLRAAERDLPLCLDLTAAPVSSPTQVAAVLWADDVARELGLPLEVAVGDMVSAELLDFAGVEAPVYLGSEERPLADPATVMRASAY